MRLNLGEVAMSLGCSPRDVLWGDKTTAPESVGYIKGTLECEAPPDWGGAAWSDIVPTGAQVDSRLVKPGNLFFCFSGEQADGHDFALAAAKAGASAIVARRDPFAPRDQALLAAEGRPLPPVFLVEDVKRALWALAMCHRGTSLARVIGVTGTAGKTSVKEVLTQVLAVRGRTDCNPMNLNNQIGLPISMLNASADASFWVMEAGISEAHDMDELGHILQPDVALILNVGEGHTQGLGELGVAAYKARLLDYIQLNGVAVVSGDYRDLNAQLEKRLPGLTGRRIGHIRFSMLSRNADVYAEYLGPAAGSAGRYIVYHSNEPIAVEAPFRGEFGAENVGAVVAVALRLGLSAVEIAKGFSMARVPGQRFSYKYYEKFILVDDSYNANPLSASRMLSAAAGMARDHNVPLVLVMGDMLELGDRAEAAHEELGEAMAKTGTALVFWKGDRSRAVACGLEKAGYAGEFYPVAGGQEFSLLLEELDLQNGLLLFKGSRGNHLERLVDIFKEKANLA